MRPTRSLPLAAAALLLAGSAAAQEAGPTDVGGDGAAAIVSLGTPARLFTAVARVSWRLDPPP